ncbi:MAG TPA: ABC transporter substrate-binding protein [Chloroflexota bacterium]|nr:ABC transporter substrate-binding protein [Chloroflexota bacterium]
MRGLGSIWPLLAASAALVVACSGPPSASPAPTPAGAPRTAASPASAPAATPPPPVGAVREPPAPVPPASAAATPATVETVRVAYNPQLPAAPILVGSDKGYFREQGIEIETERAENAAAVFQALASGEVDVGRGAIAAGTFNAFSRGVDTRIVATGHAEPPTGRTGNPVVVRKDLWDSGAVRAVPDLRGRTVAINGPAGGGEYTLGSVLRDNAMTFDDVRVAYMPFPDMVAALGGGAIDAAASIIEPQATTALRRGFAELLVPAPRPGTQTTVIFYGTRFVAERPEVARRWMLAYLRSLRDLTGEGWRKPEHLAILSRATGLPVDLIEESIAPYWDPDGRVNRDDLMAQQRFYQERGHLQYTDLLPIEALLDESWLDAALRTLGPAAR